MQPLLQRNSFSITYSECVCVCVCVIVCVCVCVCVLVCVCVCVCVCVYSQHKINIQAGILSSVACPFLQYFFLRCLIKGTSFEIKLLYMKHIFHFKKN